MGVKRQLDEGLEACRRKMQEANVDPVAIDVFAHYYRLIQHGETGMIPESTIDPLDIPRLDDVEVAEEVGRDALATTAVIKLNGGLGTSMGMDRAKSLLCVGHGMSFLDVTARQILDLRAKHDVPLPLILMNSFRTSADSMAALARYSSLPVAGLPLEFMQNKEPKITVKGLLPVQWPNDPDLEWCPPGHGDIYTALLGSGLLDKLLTAGYERAFISNSDNLGAVPDPKVAGWFAQSGSPFAIEAVRRDANDKKGGHFAIRKVDGRIVLRETAQTLPQDQAALADLDRHKFSSTNNLWIDLRALLAELDRRDGVLGLPLIRNQKTVDPNDPKSTPVIQMETAMGAAIEIFEGAQVIEVGRDRFVPVKNTSQLLILRSDTYQLGKDFRLGLIPDEAPYVALGDAYKSVDAFDKRFPKGVPSLQGATSFVVDGDWTFGEGVRIVGDVHVPATDGPGRIPDETVLQGAADSR